MSKIKNGGLQSMAKCKALTGSAVKGLNATKFLSCDNKLWPVRATVSQV